MQTIYKYRVGIDDLNLIVAPIGATMIHLCQTRPNADPDIWLEVDTEEPDKEYKIFVIPTGSKFVQATTQEFGELVHLKTLLIGGGVWHYYGIKAEGLHI